MVESDENISEIIYNNKKESGGVDGERKNE